MEHFNYISVGYADFFKSVPTEIQMHRGRMFEYTPTEIEKSLENLHDDAKNYLCSLPTFLCSELDYENGNNKIIITYGKIKNIKFDGVKVTAQFDCLINIGELFFKEPYDLNDTFNTVRLQSYRTHWAVRNGDAFDVLGKIAKKKPDLYQRVNELKFSPEAQPAIEPPARSKNTIATVKSVAQFLEALFTEESDRHTEVFFRGHDDDNYEMTPSLLRKRRDGSWIYMPNEDKLCKELIIAHYDEFKDDQYCFDRLVRMQHYGLPTRLLDVSINPLVALFFACLGSEKIDGEVIIFKIKKDKIKYFDSDTVSCISNLSNLSIEQKDCINHNLDKELFNQSPVGQKLLHYIRSEKGFFESRIIPTDLASIVCVKAKRNNSRIKSQSGAFLLYGHEVALPESGIEGIEIRRINIKNKKEILTQLNSININATTVYPGIDQTSRNLRDAYANHDL